jgi:serine/threonine-protein kinase
MSAALPLSDGQVHGYEGRMLGGFRLAREIACGGMATVYLAHRVQHAGIGQAAAIKVIHPHLARDRDFVDMFLDEARIVSCINHPNVCRVLDFGHAEGTYYLAMEYVMGETWSEVITRLKQAPEAEDMIAPVLAQVLAQACEGLHAAHEACDAQGNPLHIVHRDISPQNIIVGYDGSVRVLDFGIASAAEKLHTTRNGTIKGRFAYMAPEQMRGMPVDRRADLWSLGVVLWEGLGRKRLFKRETEAETVLAVTHDPLPTLSDCAHSVPGALQRITARALERERDARFSTARELGLELSRFATKSLLPVGMPEVSMWMHRLFAERIDVKRALLREAARAAEAQSSAPSARPTHGARRAPEREPSQTVQKPMVFDLPTEDGVVPSISAVRGVSRRTHSWTWLSITLALAITLALVTLTALLLAPDQDETAQHVAVRTTIDEPSRRGSVPTPSDSHAGAGAPNANVPEHEAAHEEGEATPAPDEAPPTAAQAADEPEASTPPDEPQPRAATRQPVRAGTVSIATPGGWAEVYLGARKLGTTPAQLKLPAGVRILRLRPFGRGPEITRRISVEPGKPTRLKIPL